MGCLKRKKLILLSAVVLSAVLPFPARGLNAAQNRGQVSRSTESAADPHNTRTEENQRADPKNQVFILRDNDQKQDDAGRWNNDSRVNRGNNDQGWDVNSRSNGSNQYRNGDADKDRDGDRAGDRDRDRDRRDRRRDRRGDRRDAYNSGLYGGWGVPYAYGYAGVPNGGYFNGDPYDAGYSDGLYSGQFDKSQGNYYNPRQYERSGNPDYFEGFVAGYEDGYRR